MEKTAKISNLERKREFKMEKTVKISILGRGRELKMEKRIKISNLGRKSKLKMEKNSQNFQFEKKKRVQTGKKGQNFQFEKEKRVQIGKKCKNFQFGIGGESPYLVITKTSHIAGSGSRIVISEKLFMSNHSQLRQGRFLNLYLVFIVLNTQQLLLFLVLLDFCRYCFLLIISRMRLILFRNLLSRILIHNR